MALPVYSTPTGRRPDRATQRRERAVLLAPATRTAQWQLPTAAETLPALWRLGHALLLASLSLIWLWAIAAAEAVWPVALALVWSWHVWRLWRDWRRPTEAFLLRWSAEPVGTETKVIAGWQVPAWGPVAVSVRSVWDGQTAVLLHLRAADGENQAWVWLHDDGGRDTHRLRTLLMVPMAQVVDATVPKRPWHDPV